MSVRHAQSVWNGNLKDGNGVMKLGSGELEAPFSFSTRFEEEPGTNPEELIGAAHSGCFSMFLSAVLTKAGFPPNKIETKAEVTLEQVDGAPWITKIHLICRADVPNVGAETDSQTDCNQHQGRRLHSQLTQPVQIVDGRNEEGVES